MKTNTRRCKIEGRRAKDSDNKRKTVRGRGGTRGERRLMKSEAVIRIGN